MLGVDVDASPDDIKAAYRKKAKELHPDVNSSVSNTCAVKVVGCIMVAHKLHPDVNSSVTTA